MFSCQGFSSANILHMLIILLCLFQKKSRNPSWPANTAAGSTLPTLSKAPKGFAPWFAQRGRSPFLSHSVSFSHHFCLVKDFKNGSLYSGTMWAARSGSASSTQRGLNQLVAGGEDLRAVLILRLRNRYRNCFLSQIHTQFYNIVINTSCHILLPLQILCPSLFTPFCLLMDSGLIFVSAWLCPSAFGGSLSALWSLSAFIGNQQKWRCINRLSASSTSCIDIKCIRFTGSSYLSLTSNVPVKLVLYLYMHTRLHTGWL